MKHIDDYNISNIRTYHDLQAYIEEFAENDKILDTLTISVRGSGYSTVKSFRTAMWYAVKHSKYKNFVHVSQCNGHIILKKVYCPMLSTRNLQLL